jgi:hypothetical protein
LTTTLFFFALYKATETFWEKGFDATWLPVDEALEKRFKRWAGKGKKPKRQTTFAKAAEVARTNTLRYAAAPQQAERILDALNSEAVEPLKH